jgi:hypothetical protein
MANMENMAATCTFSRASGEKHGGNHAGSVKKMTLHDFQSPAMFFTMFFKKKQQVRSIFPMFFTSPCV